MILFHLFLVNFKVKESIFVVVLMKKTLSILLKEFNPKMINFNV